MDVVPGIFLPFTQWSLPFTQRSLLPSNQLPQSLIKLGALSAVSLHSCMLMHTNNEQEQNYML